MLVSWLLHQITLCLCQRCSGYHHGRSHLKYLGKLPQSTSYHHSNSRKSYRMFELNIAKLNKWTNTCLYSLYSIIMLHMLETGDNQNLYINLFNFFILYMRRGMEGLRNKTTFSFCGVTNWLARFDVGESIPSRWTYC